MLSLGFKIISRLIGFNGGELKTIAERKMIHESLTISKSLWKPEAGHLCVLFCLFLLFCGSGAPKGTWALPPTPRADLSLGGLPLDLDLGLDLRLDPEPDPDPVPSDSGSMSTQN